MFVEIDFNIKLKGKMSLRRFIILVIAGTAIVANIVSTNDTFINKIETAATAVTKVLNHK